jgi:hypothetical protein
MKIYVEKWTTETVHTCKLFSIDAQRLRETCDEYACLSDEEIVERIQENPEPDFDEYGWDNEYEGALTSRDVSGENCAVNIHTTETLQDNLEWIAWHRGRLTLNEEYIDIDTENFEEFVSKIPHYK